MSERYFVFAGPHQGKVGKLKKRDADELYINDFVAKEAHSILLEHLVGERLGFKYSGLDFEGALLQISKGDVVILGDNKVRLRMAQEDTTVLSIAKARKASGDVVNKALLNQYLIIRGKNVGQLIEAEKTTAVLNTETYLATKLLLGKRAALFRGGSRDFLTFFTISAFYRPNMVIANTGSVHHIASTNVLKLARHILSKGIN